MADLTPYQPTPGEYDYLSRIAGLITLIDGYLDEIEAGRQGQASLLTNFQRYMLIGAALTTNLDLAGFRAINGGTPINPGDLTPKAWVEALAFGSALPNIAGSDGKGMHVRSGAAGWGWRDKWDPITASGSVAAGSSNAVDTTVPGIVLALPTTPVADMHLNFKDAAMNAAINPFQLDPGGAEAFEDLADGVLVSCDSNGIYCSVAYINGKWRFVNGN